MVLLLLERRIDVSVSGLSIKIPNSSASGLIQLPVLSHTKLLASEIAQKQQGDKAFRIFLKIGEKRLPRVTQETLSGRNS